ncbi:PIG-L family deacetylase [Fibrivirga algicola]|uniref:PIG-L family deacetylase n=1 Tax=Fibrivirga algicola TaxID=2950420 RepID=A0ABX0QK27_9BACT|nr:PIG-L family deacetylase [Fibrivirga algicola]ARK12165.1 GlcNAc-PI de-N-acetylase [Fibrella sp. ES10-3-2-2]NID10998.1 PIG-L family deacetylase [Fibrivirga algicola]
MRSIRSLLFIFIVASFAQVNAQSLKTLIVTAHPDDETMFPVTVFKLIRELGGSADLALVTDASGGYNGMVASKYYGMNLLDTAVGRRVLPAIRKKELMKAGEVMGITNFYFFDQVDDVYSTDPAPYLGGRRWNKDLVEKQLDEVLAKGRYDLILCLVPSAEQHAHHKAATVLALRAVARMSGKKPIVLGGRTISRATTFSFSELPGYPETKVLPSAPVYEVDVSHTFGEGGKHSYQIVADWVKAEHKSQSGDMNVAMHRGDVEVFYYFAQNGPNGLEPIKKLFTALKASGF